MSSRVKPLYWQLSKLSAFKKNLTPEKVVDVAKRSDSKLWLKIKWEETDNCDWVLAREANALCPQLVIKFYEERTKWLEP